MANIILMCQKISIGLAQKAKKEQMAVQVSSMMILEMADTFLHQLFSRSDSSKLRITD